MVTTKAVSISVATGKPKQRMKTDLKNRISKVNVKETFKDIFDKVKEEFLSEIAEPMQQAKVEISTKFGFRSDNSNLHEVDLDKEIKTALKIADLRFPFV